MGIDIHNLNFLAHAQDLGVNFGRTVSLGRQAIFIEDHWLERHRRSRELPTLHDLSTPKTIRYCEPMIRDWFAAKTVDSVDASAYEGADLIHDLNIPWPTDSVARSGYDAVLDFGCLEHVFNFPVAWRTCVDLCCVGGHVLHALPANNLSGHGFYQFSPELFFNLYQPQNGFELRALFFALKSDPIHWWQVANPLEVRRRVNLCNSHSVYMLVLARKLREVGELPPPYQSDYAQKEWLNPAVGRDPDPTAVSVSTAQLSARDLLVGGLTRCGLVDAARKWRDRLRALRQSGLSLPPEDYRRVEVARLLARPAPR